MQQQAADVLKGLATGSQQNKDAIIAAGALPVLVNLVWSSGSSLQQQAVGIFANLGDGAQQSKDAITAAGALSALVALHPGDHDEGMVIAPNC